MDTAFLTVLVRENENLLLFYNIKTLVAIRLGRSFMALIFLKSRYMIFGI